MPMNKERALEELRLLGFRHGNGPGWPGYAEIREDAIKVVCELLEETGCGDVAESFREILALPVEEY